MTAAQLESLAIYRKHKNCQCVYCQEARRTLSEFDSQPRVCGTRWHQLTFSDWSLDATGTGCTEQHTTGPA